MSRGFYTEYVVRSLAERLWAQVDGPWVPGVEWDDCWLFTGNWRSRNGYGRINRGGRKDPETQAHIAAFECMYGPVAPEHVLRHACNVKLCCNPFHLAPGTPSDNYWDQYDPEFAWACTPLGEPPRWYIAA